MWMTRPVALAVAVALAAVSTVRVPPQATVVWEAESYAEIAAPFALVREAAEASGGVYVELPLGSGQGWRNEGTGHVRYRIEAPRDGGYTLWARVLWQDGCANAFFVTVNGGERLILGNDAIYGQWHWVKLAPLRLRRGANLIEVANHSDGTALDKLVATNAPHYRPSGLGESITRFYDGFAGCDADNTGSWEFLTGSWSVLHHDDGAMGTANDCLAQFGDAPGLALTGYDTWNGYRMAASMSLRSVGTAGIVMFAGQDDALRLGLVITEEGARVQLCIVRSGNVDVLAETPVDLGFSDAWYTLDARIERGQVVGRLDGAVVLRAPYSGPSSGRTGLFTESCAAAFFDNVDVTFRRGTEEDPDGVDREACSVDRLGAGNGDPG